MWGRCVGVVCGGEGVCGGVMSHRPPPYIICVWEKGGVAVTPVLQGPEAHQWSPSYAPPRPRSGRLPSSRRLPNMFTNGQVKVHVRTAPDAHLPSSPYLPLPSLPSSTPRRDIVVAACGKAEMVTGDYTKPEATVIDTFAT